jgi:tetratricopeptide (TPR) repeat protein
MGPAGFGGPLFFSFLPPMRSLFPLAILIGAIACAPLLQAQSSNEQRAVQHLRAGQSALQSERFDEAEREFKSAIDLDPLLELAHYGLGQTYMATRRYVEAVKAYLATRDAFHRSAADQITNKVEGDRRLDDQIRYLRDARRAVESGRVRTSGVNVTTKLAEIDGQIRQLEGMRRRGDQGGTPQTPAYISIALGSAYFRTNAFAEAEREWRAALQADPKLGEAHNNLAVVLMLTGRLDEAEREVQLAEQSGHRVSEAFKADLQARKAGKG